MNKTFFKWLKFIVATLLVIFFLMCFVRQWTHFPKYVTIYISSDQDSLNTSKGLWDYLKWGESLAFFTTLSNLIAVVLIFIEWGSLGKIRINKKIKLGGLLYMIITGIIFWTSIAPFMPWGQSSFFDYENTHEHMVVLLVIIWFVLSDDRKVGTKPKDYFYVLIFPLLYLLFTSILYFATPEHIAIYPFLDYLNFFAFGLPEWASILITIVTLFIILGLFIFAYWVLVKLNNRKSRTYKIS